MTYDNITAAMVLWNEGHRIEALIERMRPYFSTVAIVVQASTDDTLPLAKRLADVVVEDQHRGFGDASFGPLLLPQVKTPWTFKVDGDEMPTIELLDSLGQAAQYAEQEHKDGVWIRFRSWIEDLEWEAKHSHLRLFKTSLGWPATLHSRPPTEKVLFWEDGWIEHRKSLDEHVRGYLSYLKVGQGNQSWTDHNRSMIWHACVGTADRKGWPFVESHEWWPEVRDTIFPGGVPETPEL